MPHEVSAPRATPTAGGAGAAIARNLADYGGLPYN